MNETSFLAQVTCMTYNHVNYITDAMNGFAMQQTSFPFVCIIVDDASTDGEPDVIKKYLDDNFDKKEIGLATEDETDEYLRIYARHKENKNCYFCVLLLKYNHYSIGKPKTRNLAGFTKTVKYVALCEGDDYWTDPLKLQKQVDYLETHEEYSMCFHGAKVLNECGARLCTDCSNVCDGDYSANDIFSSWIVPTASVVYRRELVDSFQVKHYSWFVYGDIVLFEKCAHVGKVRGFSSIMSVYRMNAGSLVQNPKYAKQRVQKMPFHFRALKQNFHKIEMKGLRRKISDSYYAKMRNDDSVIMKLFDFVCFVGYSPLYAIGKVVSKMSTNPNEKE